MSNKNCTHRSFWDIYKVINFNKKFCNKNGYNFTCSLCEKDCNLKWKGCEEFQKSGIKKYFTYFLWMLPAIILIYLSLVGIVSYIGAIIIITIFHFGAMWYIVNSDKLEIKCKKNR